MHQSNDVRIGPVSYHVSRRYTGSCTAAVLLERQIVRIGMEGSSVDPASGPGL